MSASPPVDPWTTEPGAVQRDPRTYLRILWRWKLLFLAFAVAIPVVVALLRSPAPTVYRASTLLQVQSVTVDTSLFTTPFATSQSIQAAARLIKTTAMARAAANFLDPPPANPRSLIGAISVSADTEAGFITIFARGSTPKEATDIANAFGRAVVTTRARKAIAELDRTIAGVNEELARLPAGDPGRTQLSGQLQRLRALRAAQGSNAQVIEPAAGASASTETGSRTTILSIIVGLMLGIAAVVLAEAADRRIRTPAELEEFTKLPLLSAIPASAFAIRGPPRPGHAEAFQALRGALTYFNVDRPLTSVVVISAGQQDGKTTVATQLALSVARAGKRVILVDADLRRPDVTGRLGIEPTAGLGAVLVGEASLSEVVVEYPLDEPGAVGRLLVLPAGTPPPNPSELLSSQNMRYLLARLEEQADTVIVDTAAALAVSDALPLLPASSGVVLVARMGQSTRDAVRRMQRMVVNAGGVLLGVVATGATSGGGYSGYAYDVYVQGNGDGRRSRRQPLVDRLIGGWRS